MWYKIGFTIAIMEQFLTARPSHLLAPRGPIVFVISWSRSLLADPRAVPGGSQRGWVQSGFIGIPLDPMECHWINWNSIGSNGSPVDPKEFL